jgi:hypothetical protein
MEQLCNGDQVIVRARRLYLQMARDFAAGKASAAPAAAGIRGVRSWSFLANTSQAQRWADAALRTSAA